MNNKFILSTLLIFLISLIFLFLFFFIENKTIKPIDCSKPFDVVILKPDELTGEQISDLADRINGVVWIPEQDKVVGRSEALLCSQFDYSNYINEDFTKAKEMIE